MNLQPRGIILSGYLTKSPPLEGKTRKRWHSRYFVLYDPARIQRDENGASIKRGVSFNRKSSISEKASRHLQRRNTVEEPTFVSLLYFKDKDAERKGQSAINQISLEGATVSEHPEPVHGHKFVIALNTEPRLYYLCAATEEDHTAWLETLQKTLYRSPPDPEISSSSPSKKQTVEDVPPEKNSMIQQLVQWKRERLLDKERQASMDDDTMWLENKMMADLDITDDDKKKDSGFSEKYGFCRSDNDMNSTDGDSITSDSQSEGFQERIHRLSLQAASANPASRNYRPGRHSYENVYCKTRKPSSFPDACYYADRKTRSSMDQDYQRSHSFEYNTLICTSNVEPGRDSEVRTNSITVKLPWQLGAPDDGFDEDEFDEDEYVPELPAKTYSHQNSRQSDVSFQTEHPLHIYQPGNM